MKLFVSFRLFGAVLVLLRQAFREFLALLFGAFHFLLALLKGTT